MDPLATMNLIIVMFIAQRWTECMDAIRDLQGWLAKGGAKPYGMEKQTDGFLYVTEKHCKKMINRQRHIPFI